MLGQGDAGQTGSGVGVIHSAFSSRRRSTSEKIRSHGIDTLPFTGTAADVYCEGSARDAMLLNFKVAMISDGCATTSEEMHAGSASMRFSATCSRSMKRSPTLGLPTLRPRRDMRSVRVKYRLILLHLGEDGAEFALGGAVGIGRRRQHAELHDRCHQ